MLVLVAAIVVFRASLGSPGWGLPRDSDVHSFRPPTFGVWWIVIWSSAALYGLYRAVGWGAGTSDLPLGGCLVVEAVIIPALMLISDGFLLAWVLTELRNAGFETTGEDQLDIRQAVALMPAAALACALALPARYVATLVWLSLSYLPTWANETAWGQYIRWQLGWGLSDLQGAALIGLGIAGAVAWSRGTIRSAVAGFGRMLSSGGGYLVAVVAMAGIAACLLSAAVYAVVFLLPSQSWVLFAADSYAHYATLPVGLWTLAALIELGHRSLPTARLLQRSARQGADDNDPEAAEDSRHQVHAEVARTP